MTDIIETESLPLAAETLAVDRRRIETARVRVRVKTTERPVRVDETLTHERVEVTRVPIGQTVASVPPVREENGVTIVPVVEEVLVVERRLVLVEEVYLKRVRVTEQYHETVMLREQQAVVERTRSAPLQVEPSEIGGVGGVPTIRR